MNLSSYKITHLLLATAFFISGCGGGSTSSTSTTNQTSIVNESQKAIQSGQVKDISTGAGLAGVKVSLGTVSTKTDKNGFYTLSNLDENKEAVINFEKKGYLPGSTHIKLKSLSGDNTPSSNYLEYSMNADDYQYTYESTQGLSNAHVNIDASVSYINTDGTPYNNTIAVEITKLGNNEETLIAAFPGVFKGINTNGVLVQFETYGLISLSLKDNNGDALQFADGKTGILIFNNTASQAKSNIIPLWYYDYAQGLWIEEGYAELQADGSYRGEISHPGTWSLSQPIETEPGIYRGRILSQDGTPMSDVRLYAIGDNWMSSDLSTDQDGVFEIEVNPGSSFKLSAYNYKNKYGANYNGTIPAIASGDIVDN